MAKKKAPPPPQKPPARTRRTTEKGAVVATQKPKLTRLPRKKTKVSSTLYNRHLWYSDNCFKASAPKNAQKQDAPDAPSPTSDPPPVLSELEKTRERNIKRNAELMANLGLGNDPLGLAANKKVSSHGAYWLIVTNPTSVPADAQQKR
jgi:hypothetical protein